MISYDMYCKRCDVTKPYLFENPKKVKGARCEECGGKLEKQLAAPNIGTGKTQIGQLNYNCGVTVKAFQTGEGIVYEQTGKCANHEKRQKRLNGARSPSQN